MLLHFAPIGMVEGFDYALSVKGDKLYINGDEYDFSPMGLGDQLPAEACTPNLFLEQSHITRGDNGIELTIRLPHGPRAPHDRRFMQSIVVTQDGDIELPPYDMPAEEPGVPETLLGEEPTSEVTDGND